MSSSFTSFSSRSLHRRISLPLLLLCTMLWCHVAVAQSSSTRPSSTTAPTSSTRPTSSASANASSDSGLEATPTLSILDVPTLTACADYRVQWVLSGEDPSNQKIAIQVVNVDVPQSIPPASSTSSSSSSSSKASSSAPAPSSTTSRASSSPSSASSTSSSSRPTNTPSSILARRNLAERATVNQTITEQVANVGYTWIVNVPEGRYYLSAQVGDQFDTVDRSNVFTVIEGSNTSCLAISSTNTSSTTPKSSPTSSASVGAAESGSGSEGGGGISGGAIAGIVIGALAILALIAGFFLWRRRKARRGTLYTGGEKPDMGSDTGHSGPHAIALGSLNTDGSMTSDAEKDAQRSFGSDEGQAHQSPILLTGPMAGQRTPPRQDPGNPFSSTASTPSDEAYGGYVEEHASRRASDLPVGAAGAPIPRSRSMSQPAEGHTVPLRDSPPGGVSRTGSKRRKPVPSLGAELRGQLQSEDRNRRGSGSVPPIPGAQDGTPKQSFQIMPDPPMNPNH